MVECFTIILSGVNGQIPTDEIAYEMEEQETLKFVIFSWVGVSILHQGVVTSE